MHIYRPKFLKHNVAWLQAWSPVDCMWLASQWMGLSSLGWFPLMPPILAPWMPTLILVPPVADLGGWGAWVGPCTTGLGYAGSEYCLQAALHIFPRRGSFLQCDPCTYINRTGPECSLSFEASEFRNKLIHVYVCDQLLLSVLAAWWQ